MAWHPITAGHLLDISNQFMITDSKKTFSVVVATGLMALVDDCIKERWQTKKTHHLPVLGDVEYAGARAFMQRVFSPRRSSSESYQQASPLSYASPISAY